MSGYPDLDTAKSHSIFIIFDLVKSYLDLQVTQYSKVEISFWSLLVGDMLKYKSIGEIGTVLGSYVNRGHITADEICEKFLPRLNYQEQILTLRDNAEYDINQKTTIDNVISCREDYIAQIQALV